MILAPIFTSFCRNEVSDQCLTASGKATVRMKLKSNLVVAEPHARQPSPHNRVLAFLDVLLGHAALIVEGDHALGSNGAGAFVPTRKGRPAPPRSACLMGKSLWNCIPGGFSKAAGSRNA